METAIVVQVPEAEEHVYAWRREHTPDGADGMPAHITLIYPFADTAHYAAGTGREIEEALRGYGPLQFALTKTAYFRGNQNVLYLVPEPADPLADMTRALAHRFPQYPPYRGAHETVVPHLTVASDEDLAVLASIEEAVAQALPIHATVAEAQLMEHAPAPYGWRLKRPFRLGATGAQTAFVITPAP